MRKSWINAMLRLLILIPMLSVSGTAFALMSPSASDHCIMSALAVDGFVINQTQNDSDMTNQAEHCKNTNQKQFNHQCANCIACGLPTAEFQYFALSHDSFEYSYLTRLSQAYLVKVLKPPRA